MTMQNIAPLTLTHADLGVTLSPDAIAMRDEALRKSGALDKCDDADGAALIATACKPLKQLAAMAEKCRKEVKAPVIELGRKIDRLAEEFTAPIAKEINRLQAHVNQWQKEEGLKRQEEARKREEELRKAELARREAEEAQRRAEEEAYRLRLQAEGAKARADVEVARQQDLTQQLLAKKEQEWAAKQQAAAAEALRRAKEEAAKAEAARVQALIENREKPQEKVEGVSMRSTPMFELLDIHMLARERPDLCRIEPNAAAINALIRTGTTEIPGLRCWMEKKASFA